MIRRLFTISGLSLALLVVILLLWVRSYSRCSAVATSTSRQVIGLSLDRGDFLTSFEFYPRRPRRPVTWSISDAPPNPPSFEIRTTGLVRVYDNFTGASSIDLHLPMWYLALIFSLLPTRAAIIYVRARKRLAEGKCPTCEYDLTGNVSGTCPECGTPISAHIETKA